MSVTLAAPVSEPDLGENDLDDLGLSRSDYRTLYRVIRLQREFEERIYRLFKQGRMTGAAYAGAGHEAIAAGSAYALAPQDVLVPMHRVIGAHFLRGHTPVDMMLQYYGRADAPTKGRDGNMHCGNWSKKIVGMISHLGSNIPTAAGIALASNLQGLDVVALTYIGEGGTSIGDFHEGVNFAAVRRLPLVVIIENNRYAYSTPTDLEYACENLIDRAEGYGIPGELIDGTDIREVYRATQTAVARARAGKGPTLIEAKCYRLLGHAQHDNAWYVDKGYLEEGRRHDPVAKCARLLLDLGAVTPEELSDIDAGVAKEVDEAVEIAEKNPLPRPEEALEGVYAP
ncbi:MAG: thiamine pyrophosphate-dependent dehydrogenase E1 component subunit alpha [candidate division Zixibacteria bacterium]|nr:thiamine pyrophosphate-dependent dehydrogenase E1 component subunit alpha [candidate division Zixibacteria bacterium]